MQKNATNFLIELSQTKKKFSKGKLVFKAGEKIESLGIVLKGSVQIEQNDFWGNRTILDKIKEGGFFGETYAITGEPLMVDVEVSEATEIAFVNITQILEGNSAGKINLLMKILLQISSQKNLKLSQKIAFTSPKKSRERINAFLSYQAKINGSKEFNIPFDRQQLADYLNLDRSAMSAELSKMADDGLIETRKNHFLLKR